MIKALFFDLYNTLIRYDPSREEAHALALKHLDGALKPERFYLPIAKADEYMHHEMARGPLSKRSEQERVQIMAQYERIVLKEAGFEVSEKNVAHLLGEMVRFKGRIVLFDDVLPAFTAARERGLLLGLISNAERSAYRLLDDLGLKSWLGIIVTSDEAGFSKPDPGIFRAALGRANLKPDEAVYIGDQYRIDILGARSAGMAGILVDRWGGSTGVKDCPVVRSLTEVLDKISSLW